MYLARLILSLLTGVSGCDNTVLLTYLSANCNEVRDIPTQLYDKDQILDICLAEFAQHGYEGTSVVKLAKAAGISRTLIFHHFKSKKDLYLQIVDRIVEKAGSEIELSFQTRNPDFFEAREEFSRFKFRFSKNNPTYYRIIREIMSDSLTEIRAELKVRFGEQQARYEKMWQDLFDGVALRDGVDRKQAYRFVQMTLQYFDDKYFSALPAGDELDEAYFMRFLDERNSFLEMLRYGIQAI